MNDCIFCKIASKDIPAKLRYEDDDIIAFDDIHPKAPIHILVIPKKHIESLADIDNNKILAGEILTCIPKIAKKADLLSYRVVTNIGPEAGQEIGHLHFHILGGETLGGIC